LLILISMTETKTKKRTRRNPQEIETIVLESVRKALIDHGFSNLGIELIEKYSGVDKKTIYRHFPRFQDLLTQYISKNDYWVRMLTPIEDYKIEHFRDFAKGLIVNLYATIYPDVELQQLLKWELVELSDRTKAIAQQREDLSEKIMKQYEVFFEGSGLDFNALSALLIAGIYYLILHRMHSTFSQVDVRKEKDRIPRTLEKVIDIFFDALEQHNRVIDIARKMKAKGYDMESIAEITGLDIDQVKEI
jgi:AcrR family transcriptional regulator